MDEITKYCIAEDILRIARTYNNILYLKNYEARGRFSIKEITLAFGSFKNACRELRIVNPEDPYDMAAVLNDIRYVWNYFKMISPEIYATYGIYTLESLERYYGSIPVLINRAIGYKEKPMHSYPSYSIVLRGRNVLTRTHRRYS